MEAVAEGNDPPAASIITFQQQLQSGNVKVLIFNEQTQSAITETMKSLATTNNIPIVGITETMPTMELSRVGCIPNLSLLRGPSTNDFLN